jgi:type I restriction enzyme, S subunit
MMRAPTLPDTWAMASLEDVTDPVRTISYGILKPGSNVPDGVPYVRVVNMRGGQIAVDDLRRTSFNIAYQYRRTRLVPGDVLISIRGTYGTVAIVPPELDGGNITQDSARLAFMNGIDPRFAALYLQSPEAQSYFNRVARGVAVKGINIRDLRTTPFPVPPLTEQHRIVASLESCLSQLDQSDKLLFAVLHRASRAYDEIIAAACTDRFYEPTADYQAPFPEPAGAEDGELPGIPGHWRWARLGDIAEVVGGVTKDTKKQNIPGLNEVPYLRVANVQRGWLDLSEVATIKVPPQRARQLELRPGDVLLNEGGDRDKLGRGWIWEGQIPGCIHQNHVFRARVRDGILDPKLLAWHANTFGRRWFEMNGKQSVNLASISLTKTKLLPVPIPPLEEQDRLVKVAEAHLAALRRGEEAARRARSRASYLRRSLLADAFAGKLVAQDPNDGPASELLLQIEIERAAGLRRRRLPLQQETLL